ncbi:MAG: hypothetical protein GF400_07860 [Candidatus Eisenbacteria bacterium]|nr:hypothetical protein [Candidatus Eisenbacteria bacterium]
MILGNVGGRVGGAPGRAERLLAGLVLAACVALVVATLASVADARMSTTDRERYEAVQEDLSSRIIQFTGWYHSVGQLLLHVSNYGFFGDFDADLTAPSAEWPAGSNNQYLYAGGLWVGAITGSSADPDTLVSAAVYQIEFYPDPDDLDARIYETWEGAANSGRLFDDDGDWADHNCDPDLPGFDPFLWVDEDPLDGIDNDGDGLVDEDFAAISQQMFRMEYYDIYEEEVNENAQPGDEHTALGLKVIQESYQWTSELTDDFVGINYKVVNISEDVLKMVYVGFMVDADAGPESDDVPWYTDDAGGFVDTTIVSVNPNNPNLSDTLNMSIAYMYDDPFGPDGNVAKGYFGCMFLGHPTVPVLQPDWPESLVQKYYGDDGLPNAPTQVRVHAFEIWSSGTEDPDDDRDRYRYLRGMDPDGPGGPESPDFPEYDGQDNDLDGLVDLEDDDEWRINIDRNAQTPQDYRFMLSAGPFQEVAPGDTLEFQYAFVCGQGLAGMLENAAKAQQIFDGIIQPVTTCTGDPESTLIHWVADTPPPPPRQEVTAGDHFVRIDWDDSPEEIEDPLTRVRDWYGYQVWKAVGWDRTSTEPKDQDWELILDIDRSDNYAEIDEWDTGLEGVGKYSIVDSLVRNGFPYFYSVTAYDSTAEGKHFGKYSQNMTRVVPHSAVQADVDDVMVVPNPYVDNEYIAAWNLEPDEADPTGEKICFMNLPRDAVVRVYSLGGELVETLYPEAEETGGDACWNLISRNNQIVTSGVYLYHVDSPVGEKVGKFVIIK